MTGFTKTLVALNILGLLVSLALFGTTFFADSIIIGKARQHALEKVEPTVEKGISAFEKALSNRLTSAAIHEEAEEKLRGEIARYHQNPSTWIEEMAEKGKKGAPALDLSDVKNPLASRALDQLSHGVSKATARFDSGLRGLIADLRIFSATNAIAFILVIWISTQGGGVKISRWVGTWSAALFASTSANIWLYTNQTWAWNLLTNNLMGWSYPLILFLVTLWTWKKTRAKPAFPVSPEIL